MLANNFDDSPEPSARLAAPEWTPAQEAETLTLSWQRLGMPPTTGRFFH
jgi:hypothetical protein